MKILKYIKNPFLVIRYLKAKRLAGKYGKSLRDEEFLKKAFKLNIKKVLDLDNPQSFNEKIQWLKLYDRGNDSLTDTVDKYAVKKIIADKIGEQYVIKSYGVWDCFEEIDFEKLPNQFVLKTTHDCGGVVICKDKKTFNYGYRTICNQTRCLQFYPCPREKDK